MDHFHVLILRVGGGGGDSGGAYGEAERDVR
jgi:hypothetical protein